MLIEVLIALIGNVFSERIESVHHLRFYNYWLVELFVVSVCRSEELNTILDSMGSIYDLKTSIETLVEKM